MKSIEREKLTTTTDIFENRIEEELIEFFSLRLRVILIVCIQLDEILSIESITHMTRELAKFLTDSKFNDCLSSISKVTDHYRCMRDSFKNVNAA